MRYNQILINEKFKLYIEKMEKMEQDRIYCKHGLAHFLDVCRIAYIKVLEDGMDIHKDILYAAGLLHDIGRIEEYEHGVGHHIASVHIAQEILPQCGYNNLEIKEICDAIGSHRSLNEGKTLEAILYFADKKARCCFACDAYELCKWEETKKNKGIWA